MTSSRGLSQGSEPQVTREYVTSFLECSDVLLLKLSLIWFDQQLIVANVSKLIQPVC